MGQALPVSRQAIFLKAGPEMRKRARFRAFRARRPRGLRQRRRRGISIVTPSRPPSAPLAFALALGAEGRLA